MTFADFIFSLVISLITFASLISLVSVFKFSRTSRNSDKVMMELLAELESQEKEEAVKRVITNIPTGLSEEDFFNKLKSELLEISYLQIKSPSKENVESSISKLLEMHHQQALQQSKVQFWFSILASVIGFITIITSIFFFINENWYDYVLKSIPGIVIEAVSVLFFNQARETRDRAAKFFKELNYEKQISKSVAIAETIGNEEVKSNVKKKIALHIIGISNIE